MAPHSHHFIFLLRPDVKNKYDLGPKTESTCVKLLRRTGTGSPARVQPSGHFAAAEGPGSASAVCRGPRRSAAAWLSTGHRCWQRPAAPTSSNLGL